MYFFYIAIIQMVDYQYFTKEGMAELRAEIEFLKKTERPRLTQAIADARDKGDLSENAEYDAAKEEQGMVEDRINQLEHIAATARLIDTSKVDTGKVTILSKVKVMNHNIGKESTFQIVSEKEANLKLGKISIKSAVGAGLLGKALGETVEIQVPAGLMKMEILDISF
jgi:transcription elongation factor GreA